MADSFFGNVVEFVLGWVVSGITTGLVPFLLLFVVPNAAGSITQEQLFSQLLIANYVAHAIIAALFIWWKKVFGIGFALFTLLHFFFRADVIISLLS
jgi:hypothetical protein